MSKKWDPVDEWSSQELYGMSCDEVEALNFEQRVDCFKERLTRCVATQYGFKWVVDESPLIPCFWDAGSTSAPEQLKVTCLCCGNKPISLKQIDAYFADAATVTSACCNQTESRVFTHAEIARVNAAGGWTAFLSNEDTKI